MVQGTKKYGSKPGIKSVGKSAKQLKHEQNKKKIKKGNPLQLPKNIYRDEALDDRALSRAIDKANEQKVAAKCLQGGGKINTADIKQKGKELNRDLKRSQVKRKVGRVQEKLNLLEQKAEKEGLI